MALGLSTGMDTLAGSVGALESRLYVLQSSGVLWRWFGGWVLVRAAEASFPANLRGSCRLLTVGEREMVWARISDHRRGRADVLPCVPGPESASPPAQAFGAKEYGRLGEIMQRAIMVSVAVSPAVQCCPGSAQAVRCMI